MDRIEALEARVRIIEMALSQAKLLPEPAPAVNQIPHTRPAEPTKPA
jgi:hypothetical protein